MIAILIPIRRVLGSGSACAHPQRRWRLRYLKIRELRMIDWWKRICCCWGTAKNRLIGKWIVGWSDCRRSKKPGITTPELRSNTTWKPGLTPDRYRYFQFADKAVIKAIEADLELPKA